MRGAVTFQGKTNSLSVSVITATQKASLIPAAAPIPSSNTHIPHAITVKDEEKQHIKSPTMTYTQTSGTVMQYGRTGKLRIGVTVNMGL